LAKPDPKEYEKAIERWGDAYNPDETYQQYENEFSQVKRIQSAEETKLRQELMKPDTICSTKGYICLALMIIFVVFTIIFWGKISKPIIEWLTGLIKHLLTLKPF